MTETKGLAVTSEGPPAKTAKRFLQQVGHKLEDMTEQQHKDLLHGVTLEMMLTQMVEHLGWEKMGQSIDIRCFNNDPSIKSSLQFLRKTPWARTKVEELYLKYKRNALKNRSII